MTTTARDDQLAAIVHDETAPLSWRIDAVFGRLPGEPTRRRPEPVQQAWLGTPMTDAGLRSLVEAMKTT